MNINWKVRFNNLNFWLALIPTAILLISEIAKLFGFELDLSFISEQLQVIIKTVFVLLALFGIVNDPTTAGASDSTRAMTYTEPNKE